jgi:hypothetical protein
MTTKRPKVAPSPQISRSPYTEQAQLSHNKDPNVDALYIDFLGGIDDIHTKPDNRVKLFISQLRKASNANIQQEHRGNVPYTAATRDIEKVKGLPKTGTAVKITRETGNVQFREVMSWMKEDDMYPSWLQFFCELRKRLNGKSIHKIKGSDDFIKTINHIPLPERNFAIAIVQTFLKTLIIENGQEHVDILYKPDKWEHATDGYYYDENDIINNLFGITPVLAVKTGDDFINHKEDRDKLYKIRTDILKENCSIEATDSPREFEHYKLERYASKEVQAAINKVLKEQKEKEAANAAKKSSEEPFMTSSLLETIKKHTYKSEHKYKYIRNQDKELYIVYPDGTKISATELALRDNGKATCDATGIYVHGCQSFLRDCINGRNIGQCKMFLANPDYWVKDLHKLLDNTNLFLAHIALKAYKIPTFTKADLIFYKSVKDWHASLDEYVQYGEEDLDSSAVNHIKKNEELTALLDALINAINARPAILNPSVIGDTVIETENESIIFKYLVGKTEHGLMPKPRIVSGTIKDIVSTKVVELEKKFEEIKQLMPQLFSSINGSKRAIQSHPRIVIMRPQRGAGPNSINTIIASNDFYEPYNRINEMIDNIETGVIPPWLLNTVTIYNNILKESGINISPDDLDNVKKVINTLKDTEKNILIAIKVSVAVALVLHSDIGSVLSDDPKDDVIFAGLRAVQNKTIDQMFEMYNIAMKKLNKHCSKMNKVGGICDHLVSLTLSP